jgi:hypothetical protein
VAVKGGVAAAVGDDHVVAVGAGVLGDDDLAGLGGMDGGIVAHAADVDALVVGAAHAVGGAGGAVAEAGVDLVAGDGPDVAGGGYGRAAGVVLLPRRLRLLPGGLDLRGQLPGQRHDAVLDFLLLGGEVVHGVLIAALAGVELRHQGVGRAALLVQLALLAHQIGLYGLGVGLVLLQAGLLGGDLLLQRLEIVDDPLVGVHDLVDGVQPGEQVRETGGLKQHGPVAHVSLLLHGADAPAEQVVLGLLPLLGVLQLRLRLGDQRGVGGDLLLGVGDLGGEVADLPVQIFLFLHGVGDVAGDGVQLALQGLFLAFEITGVALEGIDVRLGDGPGGRRTLGDGQRRQKHQRHRGAEHPAQDRMGAELFHGLCEPPLPRRKAAADASVKTAGICGWRRGCLPRR